jgi:hypothetical protein
MAGRERAAGVIAPMSAIRPWESKSLGREGADDRLVVLVSLESCGRWEWNRNCFPYLRNRQLFISFPMLSNPREIESSFTAMIASRTTRLEGAALAAISHKWSTPWVRAGRFGDATRSANKSPRTTRPG